MSRIATIYEQSPGIIQFLYQTAQSINGTIYTTLGTSPTLYEYQTKDGVICREFVQYRKEMALHTVDVTCFFLALKNKDENIIKETLWSDEGIAKQIKIYKKRYHP